MYIGCHLIFNEDIAKTASDCMFKLTRANRIKHLLDKKTLIYLINAFVRRDGVARARNVRKLQLVQNYAYRIVAGLRKYDHVSEALKSLKWLNVRNKLLCNDLVMMYKCLKKLTPGELSIYEKNPEISVVAKVEFPIGKKLFHLVANPGTWPGARPWTWN